MVVSSTPVRFRGWTSPSHGGQDEPRTRPACHGKARLVDLAQRPQPWRLRLSVACRAGLELQLR
ncbi:hypothetical protein EJB05_46054, partial [Eragrostis curvula]